ncbi:MAG: hypothetical protein RLY58_974 [Pseudomonadota bacterium]|jgi:hypothetical protein
MCCASHILMKLNSLLNDLIGKIIQINTLVHAHDGFVICSMRVICRLIELFYITLTALLTHQKVNG